MIGPQRCDKTAEFKKNVGGVQRRESDPTSDRKGSRALNRDYLTVPTVEHNGD